MNLSAGTNSMNAVMDQSFWLCIIFLLNFSSIQAETLNKLSEAGSGSCPLNITQELDAHPWIVDQCSRAEKSHCCESISDLIKILHFSWMHTTSSFVLPTNYTAAVCLNEFHRQLEARTGTGAQVFSGCNVSPQSLVSDSSTCLGIGNLSTFESRVDSSDMKLNCNASRPGDFSCNKCLTAMAMALRSLDEGSGGKSNCPFFVMIYVEGGINCYDSLGPDAAFCLQSVENLTALAANTEQQHRQTKTYFLAAAIPAVGILIVLFSICGYLNRRKSRLRKSKRKNLMQRYDVLNASTGLTFFSLSEIRDSTGNFAASNVIGKGGFSTVYGGTLPNGSRIAVKRLKYSNKIKGAADLTHELRVISSIKHCNLLPLRGYCIEFNEDGQISEQLLVSDLMENGSLADCLFNSKRPTSLSWPERYKIAVGIARGLTYLHEFAKPTIIHRDVKAANVLLDAHFNAIVTDFGLAKLKKEEEEKTHYSTRTVGTLGYVAPEYALYGHLTVKSDVFSFGIILLELITGRRALNLTDGDVEHFLLSDWVFDMAQHNRVEEVIDKKIRESGYRKTIEKVLFLALRCAHPRVVSRPSMSEVLLALEAIDGQLSGTKEIELELGAPCNSRGDLTWFLSPGMPTDDSTIHTEERSGNWSTSSGSAND